jgi:hypothetical protein
MAMTIEYLIQLKSYFEISTILTLYTLKYIYYIFFMSIVHNNHSVEVLFFYLFCYI